MRTFDIAITTNIDGTDSGPTKETLQCARNLLEAWAAAGALLKQPSSFYSIRERARFTIGINIAAFKLQRHGAKLDRATLDWLRTLNAAIMNDFQRRNIVDNLYLWSAVDAASYALLDRDPDALAYLARVWPAGLAQVGENGFVPSELKRQGRALLYHQYYLSALLFLKELRATLGAHSAASETAAIQRLGSRVQDSLCNPAAMETAAGGFHQEIPPPIQFSVGVVFGAGILDKRFTSCGVQPTTLRDETLGGRLDLTLEALRANRT